MVGDEVWIGHPCEGEGVEKEEAEDYDDTEEDGVPELFVHAGLDGLFPLPQILNRGLQRIKRPDIESGKCSGQWQDDEEDDWSGALGGDGEGSDGVDQAEDKVGEGEPADPDHGFAKGGLDDAVAHADDEEEEEGEGVAGCVEHCNDDHECLGASIAAIAVLEV